MYALYKKDKRPNQVKINYISYNKNKAVNYRPIALTSHVIKIYERVVRATRIAPVFPRMRALYYPPMVSEFKFVDNIS